MYGDVRNYKSGKKVSSNVWKFQSSYASYYNPDIVLYEQNGKWGLAKITY